MPEKRCRKNNIIMYPTPLFIRNLSTLQGIHYRPCEGLAVAGSGDARILIALFPKRSYDLHCRLLLFEYLIVIQYSELSDTRRVLVFGGGLVLPTACFSTQSIQQIFLPSRHLTQLSLLGHNNVVVYTIRRSYFTIL